MTQLFQETVSKASSELNQQDQDRFAQFILANVGKLHDLVEDVLEEYVFEKQAITAIESDAVQRLFMQVAEKHQTYCSEQAVLWIHWRKCLVDVGDAGGWM